MLKSVQCRVHRGSAVVANLAVLDKPLPGTSASAKQGIKSAGTWLDDKIKRNFLLYWFGNEGPAASLVIPDHLRDGAGGQVGGKAAVWIPAAMKGNLLSRKCDWALFNCCSLVGRRVG